jgi:hypothetical protein
VENISSSFNQISKTSTSISSGRRDAHSIPNRLDSVKDTSNRATHLSFRSFGSVAVEWAN